MAGHELVAESPARPSGTTQVSVGLFDRAKFAIVRGFLLAWARCFSLKGLYLFGQFFGTCEWLIDWRRRRRFGQRLRTIFEPQLSRRQVRRITWRYFRRVRCDKMIYLIFDKLPREKILKRIKFHGKEHLDQALRRGKGVYVTMAHFGSHHVSALLMALSGYRVAGVRDRNEGALRRYIQQRYAESFPEFRAIRVFFSDSFPRDLYRCFQANYVLGSALDVDRDRGAKLRTATVTIFGQQREFLTGTMQIALRCRATILQGFLISRKNYYFRVVILPPLIDPDNERDDQQILAEVMQRYAEGVERHVRAYPCHLSKL
ncbi:MAG: lysophospholipid acyltransferase family protein [Phycisphaerae bacterium]